MDSSQHKAPGQHRFAEEICRMIVRPIVGLLLRNGLSFSRFSEICRSVYVDVAAKEFGLEGRRTNTSRIALLTGLSRTRVKQELDKLDAGQDQSSIDQVRPASRILMAWHADPDFLDKTGKPRVLTVEGGEHSFKDLYDKYSGKIAPMTAMLKELRNVGAVESLNGGKLRVISRTYVPRATDAGALKRVCMAVRDLTETGSYNLYRDEHLRARFERFATNQLIPANQLDEFTEFLNQEGQAFLERADNWLIGREADASSDDTVRVGVGVYQIAPWTVPDAGKNK